jgi:hypothetical protein
MANEKTMAHEGSKIKSQIHPEVDGIKTFTIDANGITIDATVYPDGKVAIMYFGKNDVAKFSVNNLTETLRASFKTTQWKSQSVKPNAKKEGASPSSDTIACQKALKEAKKNAPTMAQIKEQMNAQ